MRLPALLILASSLGLVSGTGNNGCAQNACAKQVTNTKCPLAQASARRAECSAYLRVTVTPAATTKVITKIVPAKTKKTVTVSTTTSLATKTVKTVTDTATATVTANSEPQLGRDQFANLDPRHNGKLAGAKTSSATGKPKYATACSNAAQYQSACSCWGVTRKTITLPRPTVLSTTTRTVTSTVKVTSTAKSTISKTAFTTVTTTTAVAPPVVQPPVIQPPVVQPPVVQPPVVQPPDSSQCNAALKEYKASGSDSDCDCCWKLTWDVQRRGHFASRSEGSFAACAGYCEKTDNCVYFTTSPDENDSDRVDCKLFSTSDPEQLYPEELADSGARVPGSCARDTCYPSGGANGGSNNNPQPDPQPNPQPGPAEDACVLGGGIRSPAGPYSCQCCWETSMVRPKLGFTMANSGLGPAECAGWCESWDMCLSWEMDPTNVGPFGSGVCRMYMVAEPAGNLNGPETSIFSNVRSDCWSDNCLLEF